MKGESLRTKNQDKTGRMRLAVEAMGAVCTNGAESFLDTLADLGVRRIFGIVGREADSILFNENQQIEFVLTRDERTAATAAYVYGRLMRRPGICYSTFGPGMTNLVTGMAGALLDRCPAIFCSAQVEDIDGHPESQHQYVAEESLARPVTKWVTKVSNASQLREAVYKAFKIAIEEPWGPTFISIPANIFREEETSCSGRVNTHGVLDGPWELCDYKNLISAIKSSKLSVIVVGAGILRADPEARRLLVELTERCGMGVLTTYAGKGCFPENHPLYLGTYSKYLCKLLRINVERTIFGEADLIMVLGVDSTEGIDWNAIRVGKNKTVFGICGTSEVCQNGGWDGILTGNLTCIIKDLLKKIPRKKRSLGLTFTKSIRHALISARQKMIKSVETSAKTGISPFKVLRLVEQMMQKNDILVSDVGLHKQIVSLFHKTLGPDQFICSNGCGAMGFALPAAVGAAFARPRERVFVICGDGGFQLASPDLETCARYGLNVAFLILQDQHFELIRHYQIEGHHVYNPDCTRFGPIDYAMMAKSMGCAGYKVNNIKDLCLVLKKVCFRKGPTVIDIPVNYDSLQHETWTYRR